MEHETVKSQPMDSIKTSNHGGISVRERYSIERALDHLQSELNQLNDRVAGLFETFAPVLGDSRTESAPAADDSPELGSTVKNHIVDKISQVERLNRILADLASRSDL